MVILQKNKKVERENKISKKQFQQDQPGKKSHSQKPTAKFWAGILEDCVHNGRA